jgi:hypothetical protein
MGKFFKTIAKIFAFLFALLFIISLPTAVLAYDSGRVLFNPEVVKEVATESFTDSELIAAALASFSKQEAQERYTEGEAQPGQGEPNIVRLMASLEQDAWQQIRKELIPRDVLKTWVAETVDGLYRWIDSDHKKPEITWDLKPVVRNMEQNGDNVIMIAYESLEPCTEPQIKEFERRLENAPAGSEILYNLCQFPMDYPSPTNSYGQDQLNDYQTSLDALVLSVPPQIALTQIISAGEEAPDQNLAALKQQLRGIRMLMNLAPLLPLSLLLLILLVGIRSLKDLGIWWGIPILAGSLVTLSLSLLFRPLLSGLLLDGRFPQFPPQMRAAGLQMLLSLVSHIFRAVRWQSLVLLVIGIGLIALMIITSTEKEPAS